MGRDPHSYAIYVSVVQLAVDQYLVTARATAVEHSGPTATFQETITVSSLAEARSKQRDVAIELSRRLVAQGHKIVDVYTSL